MQPITMMRPPTRMRNQNQFSQFKWTSTKILPIEKTLAGHNHLQNSGLFTLGKYAKVILQIQFLPQQLFGIYFAKAKRILYWDLSI